MAVQNDGDSYPYAVVPIAGGPGGGVCLIRIISFDTSHEIDNKELSTVKLMGEHLCNMPQFGQLVEKKVAEQQREMFNAESILIIHSNRLTRRRYSRVLSGSYRTYEADSADKALEILQENLAENRIDLIVLDGEDYRHIRTRILSRVERVLAVETYTCHIDFDTRLVAGSSNRRAQCRC